MNWNKNLVLCILIIFISCAKYSFRGALPSYLETLYIQDFQDKTNYPGAWENFMQQVTNAFIIDNSLKVIEDEKSADLVLKGTLMSVKRRPTSINPQETVQEYQMVLTIRTECFNTHSQKPLWSGNISRFGIIDGTALRDEIDNAILVAIDQIVEDIISKTIGAW
ncbi:MAG: LptE family protein [Calditrichia bacterium]|nr:LptE family protein [Calditrichia bacterium]